jgi:putative phosphoribosyl transferase
VLATASRKVRPAYLNAIIAHQRAEARRCESVYRAVRPKARIERRVVILVDDGLATGATMRAALYSIRKDHPRLVVVAVSVGATETCELLRSEAAEVVCVHERAPFFSIDLHYVDFSETTDDEVIRLLEEAWKRQPGVQRQPAARS